MREYSAQPLEPMRGLAGRPLLLAALLFALGIWTAVWLPQMPAFLLLAALPLTLFGFLGSQRFPLVCFSLISLAFFVWGAGMAQLRSRVEVPFLLDDEEIVEGRVTSVALLRDGRTRLNLEVRRILRAKSTFEARFGVRLSVDGAPSVFRGDVLRARVRLRPIDGPQNQGMADLRAGYAAQGILFSGRVVRGQWSAIGSPPRAGLFQRGYRERFADLCARAMRGDAAAKLVRNLGLGERSALPEETLEDFRATGLAHLLSVSGLHVGVVALGCYRLLRWLLSRSVALVLSCDVLRIASLTTLPLCWGYVFLSGAAVPAIRAGAMVSALFFARILGRDQDAPSALCLAGMTILALDPAALHAISFQLSFVAVAALMLLQPPLCALLQSLPSAAKGECPARSESTWRMRCAQALCSTIAATLAASLATAPLVATAFQQASLVAVFANVVALPIGSALTVLSASAALLMPFAEPIAALLLCLADPIAALLLAVTRWMATIPLASWRVPPPSAWTVAMFYAALLAIPLWARSRQWAAALACLGLIGIGAGTCLPLIARHLDDSLRVTFFAVGQGDAALIRFPDGRAMLIDGGGDPEGRWRVGEKVLLPALRSLGIHRIDIALLSHPHPDHALGLIDVAGTLKPREIWVARDRSAGQSALTGALIDAARGAELIELAAGDRRTMGEVALEILHPPSDAAHLGDNDASLAVRLAFRGVSFLFTGDLERAGERMLLEAHRDLSAIVLKVPHHGSRTSSTPQFVKAVAPAHAVFSCGRHNLFGFPSPAVVSRYEAVGSAIHRTDRDGAITFVTDGKSLRVDKPFAALKSAGQSFLRSALDAPDAFEAKALPDVPATTKGKAR